MPTRVRIACFAVHVIALALAAAPAARAGSLNALGWMSGSWAADHNGVHEEEHWMAPRGNLMVGMHRDVAAGKPASFEFFRIEAKPEGVFYVTQPGGAPMTAFKLVSQSRRQVVFENQEHDYPQRIMYWQDKPDQLRARIAGTLGGKPDSTEWTWTRSKLAP